MTPRSVFELDLEYPHLQAALDTDRDAVIDAARRYIAAPDAPRRDVLTRAVERLDRVEAMVADWQREMAAALRAQRLATSERRDS